MVTSKKSSEPVDYKPIRSPFKWAGGKSRLRKYIIELIPEHSCYVEPFAGAAWVLFGKPPSDVEVLNDIDEELITFFRVVKHKPEELIRSFEWELVSRAEFERLAALDPKTLSDVERAHRFYYIIMAGWGGEHNYPRFQTSISDGGHGNRLFGGIKFLEKRISPAYERLKTVIIENMDWRDCLRRYDSARTFMYLDPPYPGNPINYKHNMKDWKEHGELVDFLRAAKSKWILSSYDDDNARQLFDGLRFVQIQAYSGMRKSKKSSERTLNKEVLVLNFNPKDETLPYATGGVQKRLDI